MRLVGFDQGRVTLELDAEECQFLSRACQTVLSSPASGPDAAAGLSGERLRRFAAYRSLGRALLACARVGHTQHGTTHGLTVARTLSITDRRPSAIVVVD